METEVHAERVEEEELSAEPVEEDDFDVLEDDHDLPTAERVKKPKRRRPPEDAPRRRTVQDDLYSDSSESFLGFDMAGSARTVLYVIFVGLFGCCAVSGIVGVLMRLFNSIDKLKN